MTKIEIINALHQIKETCWDITAKGKTCRDCPYHILDTDSDEFCSLYVAFNDPIYFKDPYDWDLSVMEETL